MTWDGNPTIINPTIAGVSKRKIDVLDSRLLTLHGQLNIWRECYVPNEDVPPLRVLFAQRDRCVHEATATGKRINNIITRFGLIVGHNGSVVRDRKIHAIVEDQISDDPTSMEGLCPILIPLDVCLVLRNEYENFGQLTAQAAEYKAKIFDIARSMQWETDTGSLPGDEKFGI